MPDESCCDDTVCFTSPANCRDHHGRAVHWERVVDTLPSAQDPHGLGLYYLPHHHFSVAMVPVAGFQSTTCQRDHTPPGFGSPDWKPTQHQRHAVTWNPDAPFPNWKKPGPVTIELLQIAGGMVKMTLLHHVSASPYRLPSFQHYASLHRKSPSFTYVLKKCRRRSGHCATSIITLTVPKPAEPKIE